MVKPKFHSYPYGLNEPFFNSDNLISLFCVLVPFLSWAIGPSTQIGSVFIRRRMRTQKRRTCYYQLILHFWLSNVSQYVRNNTFCKMPPESQDSMDNHKFRVVQTTYGLIHKSKRALLCKFTIFLPVICLLRLSLHTHGWQSAHKMLGSSKDTTRKIAYWIAKNLKLTQKCKFTSVI